MKVGVFLILQQFLIASYQPPPKVSVQFFCNECQEKFHPALASSISVFDLEPTMITDKMLVLHRCMQL